MTDPRFLAIDWQTWTPAVRATLLFVRRGDEVLLIRKKRGLGAGKINGPGGKIDPGETAVQCAIREVQEELCVTALDPVDFGELSFEFVDGLRLQARIFVATAHEGTPTETDEAVPLWTPVSAIPYDQMWADDRLWLPEVLAGRKVALRALFDADTMLGYSLDVR